MFERDGHIAQAHSPPSQISKLFKQFFIVSKSCRALPYPQNITNKIHLQLQHVERRLLGELTGQAVENVGKRKHFYSATAYQSRLSLHSVEFIVNMASYGHYWVTRNSLVGIIGLEHRRRLPLSSTFLLHPHMHDIYISTQS